MVQANKYQSIFQNAGEGIFLSTPEGALIEANPAFVKTFGCHSLDALMQWAGADLSLAYKKESDRASMVEYVRTRERYLAENLRMVKVDGQEFWARLSVTLHIDQNSGRELFLGVLQDVTDQRLNMLDLEYRATRDALTRLPNRRLFMDRLNNAMARAKRHGRLVGVLFIDLNGFKGVNDLYGHLAGDRVLQQVGERILRRTRASDTSARIGGDEFAMILDQVQDREAAAKVASSVGAIISRPYLVDEKECRLGASIGVGIYPTDGEDAQTLLRLADQAMYRAKSQGRGFCFCSELAKSCCEAAGETTILASRPATPYNKN
jgi:diguanylate cyclase (GGDEF)-like protein/PAS domain S-box-containing protein